MSHYSLEMIGGGVNNFSTLAVPHLRKPLFFPSGLAVVLSLVALALLCNYAYGNEQHVRMHFTGTRINENEGGLWRNVRLGLVFEEGATWTSGSMNCGYTPPTPPECHFPDENVEQFTLGLHDHLVYKNLDNPNDRGNAIPLYAVSEYQDNHDGRFGTSRYHHNYDCLDRCPETPWACCDSIEWTFSRHLEADLLITLPTCGRWRVYYVLDGYEWLLFCGASMDPDLVFAVDRTILMQGMGAVGHCAGIDTNLVQYITRDSSVTYQYIDIDMGPCPDPPPPLGEPTGKFVRYLDPRGGDGRNWLPVPGDSIGLVFEISTNPPGSLYNIAYHIWDMTMWKGECMNSPRYDSATVRGQIDPEPRTTGFFGRVRPDSLRAFRNFDFTLGQPRDYTIYVRDTMTVVKEPRFNLWPIQGDTVESVFFQPAFEFAQTRKLFKTEIIALDTSNARYDTLWLKALDYGAHCIVTPEFGGGKDRRLRSWDGPWNQTLWSVTVPYDYDGYSMPGVNFGDCMADAWEKKWFSSPDTIPYFRPFAIPNRYHRVNAPLSSTWEITDFDTLPKGRGIDGDWFCNFAEYRGLMVAEDSSRTHSDHIHRRLKPFNKTVIAHVRENMDDDTASMNMDVFNLMPGYIYKMQLPSPVDSETVEIFFTDSIRFTPRKTAPDDSSTIERVRVRRDLVNRDINFNRAGAGLWYYGLGAPLTDPMPKQDTIRAVTFWAWTKAETDSLDEYERTNWLGLTFPKRSTFGSGWNRSTVPNETIRCLVNTYAYEQIRDSVGWYADHDSLWNIDFPLQCSRTIAHEFGHTVGMIHEPDSLDPTIMSSWRPYWSVIDSTRRFMIHDSVYTDSSKAQLSIKER